MNDRVDVEAILDRFRDWLEAARAEAETDGDLEPGSTAEPGSRPASSGSSISSRNSRHCGTS